MAHDKAHPFVVKAGSVSVEALGTEFNVCSYKADSLTTVTLTDGLVKENDRSSKNVVMTPGQVLVYNVNNNDSKLFLGSTEKNVAWRYGRLVFKNETLENVYKRIGLIYGVNFEVDSRLRDVLFYATFDNASLEQILMLIRKSTPLEYTTVEDDSAGCKGPVVRVKSKS